MKNRLDCSALVHCALMNENWINAYRITATMTEKIDHVALQQAMDSMPDRYPTICSRIVKGFSWYYTEKLNSIKVRPLDCGLLGSVNYRNVFSQAINIMYDDNRIILEAFHSVTDGHGAFTFLNSLLGTYCSIISGSLQPSYHKGTAVEEEFEDAFLRYGDAEPVKEIFAPVDNPFFFSDEGHDLDATIFKMKSAQVRQLAKNARCSMNDLLVATVFKAIFRLKGTEGKSVALTVPVNLRRYFDTPSLLNFSYLSTATIKNRDSHMPLHDMAMHIREQLKKQNNEKHLRRAISKIVAVSKAPYIRYVPVFVKNFVIKLALKLGVEKTCMTVTNLGNVAAMLPAAEGYLKNVDVLLSPRRSAPYNCGIVSYNDDLHLILTHNKGKDLFVKGLTEQLSEMGIEFTTAAYI